jgi:hypothetical protein
LLTSHARQRSSGADGSAARSAGVSGVPRLDAPLGVVASPAIDGVGVVVVVVVVVVVPARVALGPRRDRRRAVLGVVAARASELDVGVRSPARDGLNMACAARACGARARGSARVPGDADIAGSPTAALQSVGPVDPIEETERRDGSFVRALRHARRTRGVMSTETESGYRLLQAQRARRAAEVHAFLDPSRASRVAFARRRAILI